MTAQYTNPAPDSDDEPQLIGLLGELAIEVKGTGDLEAALKAYLAGQIFMFKGEFFSFDIASAKLARLRAGGRLGWRFQDAGEAKFFKEPTNPSGNWVDFNWILGEILEARKMDKAQARLKAAAADVQALQDLQAFFDAPQDGRPMRRYRRRWHIERLFAWFHNHRRTVVRWEYYAENFLAMVKLVCARILLRHL